MTNIFNSIDPLLPYAKDANYDDPFHSPQSVVVRFGIYNGFALF